jgi:DNA-binding LytR/AlgR family response regulator
MNCILVDDEPLALDLLDDNLKGVPFVQVLARCRSVVEADAILKTGSVDLVFCDIRMPGITGLQWLRSLSVKPLFVFITAYEQHAVESFALDVVDYLLKPVEQDRLLQACNKALQVLEYRTSARRVTDRKFMFLNLDYSMVKIMFEDIVRIEAWKDYVRIYLRTSKPLVVRISMKAMEDLLPPSQFIRVHRSHIVSIAQLEAVHKSTVSVQGCELPIGEGFRDNVISLVQR